MTPKERAKSLEDEHPHWKMGDWLDVAQTIEEAVLEERERCAKIAHDLAEPSRERYSKVAVSLGQVAYATAWEVEGLIRATKTGENSQ